MPNQLGTINGYFASSFMFNGVRVNHTGTTLCMVIAAIDAGAVPGDKIYCMTMKQDYTITETGGGERTHNGWWASRTLFNGEPV